MSPVKNQERSRCPNERRKVESQTRIIQQKFFAHVSVVGHYTALPVDADEKLMQIAMRMFASHFLTLDAIDKEETTNGKRYVFSNLGE